MSDKSKTQHERRVFFKNLGITWASAFKKASLEEDFPMEFDHSKYKYFPANPPQNIALLIPKNVCPTLIQTLKKGLNLNADVYLTQAWPNSLKDFIQSKKITHIFCKASFWEEANAPTILLCTTVPNIKSKSPILLLFESTTPPEELHKLADFIATLPKESDVYIGHIASNLKVPTSPLWQRISQFIQDTKKPEV